MALTDAEKLAAISLILSGSTPAASVVPMPPPAADRWKPTDAQKAAFAARIGWTVADLDGDRKDPISPCDGTVDDAWLYASFGFTAKGLRNAWVSDDRDRYRNVCDELRDADTPEKAEAAVKGSSKFTPDYVRWLVMQGKYVGGLLYTEGSATTVADYLAQNFQTWASGQTR